MFKFLFAFFVLIHGLIHFMGFAKAFGYGNITQLTKEISKPAGICWFLTAVLFIITIVLFLFKKDGWETVAIISVIISQILIILWWKDAKFGTIANVIVLLVAIPAIANILFNKMVHKEVAAMLSKPATGSTIVTNQMLQGLPSIVGQWLSKAGIVGKEKTHFVRLKQIGQLRTKPGGKWMPFTATQYFNADDPGFIWQANVKMMNLVSLNGRDKLVDGKGEMLIKMLSVINVAKAGGDQKTNEAAMLRYLAETCWFPSSTLNKYITWKAIDPVSAGASMHCDGFTVTGIMRFNQNGLPVSFTAMRYMGSGPTATRQKWLIEISGYKDFEGILIPSKCKVTWQPAAGDFYWLNLEVTELEFNNPEIYK